MMNWGITRQWDKERKPYFITNLTVEKLARGPFKSVLAKQRCIIPADGFYEWKKDGYEKIPFFIHMEDSEPFGLAGLWETWRSPAGERVRSFAIVTTDADALLAEIHGRMPVIIGPADYGRWLDPRAPEPGQLRPLLRPYPAEEMAACPVGPRTDGRATGRTAQYRCDSSSPYGDCDRSKTNRGAARSRRGGPRSPGPDQ